MMKRGILLLLVTLLPLTVLAENVVKPLDNEENTEEKEAQIVYVTDRLRLSLYREPGSKGGKIKTLTTGDRLTLLEETGRYMRVKTEEGEEGWVTKLYIVKKEPATLRVEYAEAQLRIYEQKVLDLEETIKNKSDIKPGLREDYEKQLIKTNEENVQLFNEKEQYRKKLDQAGLEIAHLKQQLDDHKISPDDDSTHTVTADRYQLAQWTSIAAISGLLLGVIWGYRLYARKIKKRFHGFEI
ncbi:MAG TPA: TIGR04211 family SH3 domain-containing protein [Gammaproteobacteria bacterium]|nr:TIGR04211 family SH3 domain-containing protein [Gammaproteobacteria bacterium]